MKKSLFLFWGLLLSIQSCSNSPKSKTEDNIVCSEIGELVDELSTLAGNFHLKEIETKEGILKLAKITEKFNTKALLEEECSFLDPEINPDFYNLEFVDQLVQSNDSAHVFAIISLILEMGNCFSKDADVLEFLWEDFQLLKRNEKDIVENYFKSDSSRKHLFKPFKERGFTF